MILHQAVELFLDVPQLPNFRDIHTDATESPTDIANDAGAVLDDKAHVEWYVDFFFALQFQCPRRDEAGHAGKSALATRQFTDVSEHRDRRRTATGTRTHQDIITVALATPGATSLAGEAYRVSRPVNAGEKIFFRDQHRRNEDLYCLTIPSGHRQLLDRAAAAARRVAEIHRLTIFDAFAPDIARVNLYSKINHSEQCQLS